MNKWISEPNKCNGCPIEREQWFEFKLCHFCDSPEWEISHRLDEKGRVTCELTRKKNFAMESNKVNSCARIG